MTENIDKKFEDLKKYIDDNFKDINNIIQKKFDELFSAIDKIFEIITEIKLEKEFEKQQAAELEALIKETVSEESAPALESKPIPIVKTPTVPVKPTVKKPPIVEPVIPKPVVKKPSIIKPVEPKPTVKPATVPIEVHQILDGISNAVKSGVSAKELYTIMNNARDSIIKVYKWHPVLYELASFSRRIQKIPESQQLDNEISSLLIDKINDWKMRITEG